MKILKLLLALMFAVTLQASAQSTPQSTPQTIKGNITINYNTQVQGLKPGVKDVYDVNINLCNAVLFHGNILDTPQITGGLITTSVTQPRGLNYDIACDVINPKVPFDPNNSRSVRNVAQLKGRVGITSDGVYQYDNGNVSIDILAGRTSSSKFTGLIAGKPLIRPTGWFESLKCQTVNITRSINGKTSTVTLNKYDKMEFRNHVLAAGPIGDTVTVNGEMLYDYDKKCWFFNSFKIDYTDELVATNNGVATRMNVTKTDRITGTIRWVPSKTRLDDGHGVYNFDVRLNEPLPSASAAFDAKPTTSASYFDDANDAPGLVGTMTYQDKIRKDGSEDGITLHSDVAVDLSGTGLSSTEMMSLCKLIIFSTVIPMNSN